MMTVPSQPELFVEQVSEEDVDPVEALLFFYLEVVPYPTDDQMHALAASLGKRKEHLEEKVYRMLKEAMKFPNVKQKVLSSVEEEEEELLEEESDSHTDEGWENVDAQDELLLEPEEAAEEDVFEVEEEEESALDPVPVPDEECVPETAEPVDPLVDPVGDDELIMNDGTPEAKGEEKIAEDIEMDGIPDVQELDDNFGNTP
jgi:hypothetical protein